MRHLQPVIWSKGTFLTPQHLQLQDRVIEDTLQFRLQALNFCPWGFYDLEIDQEKLAAGQFAISRATGILPDGLLFEIPASDPPPPAKPLKDYFEADQNELDVYLAIPTFRVQGTNVSLKGENGSRFMAEFAMLRDENTGMMEKPVQVARKNFRLLVEGESREGTSNLRVARVKRTAAGYQLDSQFVPPIVNITASAHVFGILRSLVEVLSAKSASLAGNRKEKNQSLAEFSISDIADFWLLYAVNSHFPVLHHLFVSEKAHPELLYAEMISLAGALTAFSSNVEPRSFPAYDHNELGPCFSRMHEILIELLNPEIGSKFISLPLKLVQPFTYAVALDEERYLKGTRMYLAIASEAPKAELLRKVPQMVKLTSGSQIERIVAMALPGVTLTHQPQAPRNLPVKLKYQYFALNQSGPDWEAICRARNLAVFVPNEITNPEMELIILLPEKQ